MRWHVTKGETLALFAQMPRDVFKALRFYMDRSFKSFRETFPEKADIDPNRRDVLRQRNKFLSGDRRGFFYEINPPRDQIPAVPDLRTLRASVSSFSRAALGLEVGGTSTAKGGGYLALPIGFTKDSLGRTKTKWTTPKKFATATQTRKDLVSIERPGGARILYWRKRVPKSFSGPVHRGAGRKSSSPGYILVPVFMLVRSVNRKARLHFFRTWTEEDTTRRGYLQEGIAFVMASAARKGVTLQRSLPA